MDFGSKLQDLELTTDEITRLNKALKDEKFRELLREYTEEITNPENRRKYEEEITQLEQEKGMDVQFVHPKPHHVLKTSLNGQEKCFINICSNELISQPSCQPGRGQDGRVGQHWSLPYSLAAGRSDRDAKGNKCSVYDVVFHPDTLYIAGNNTRFLDLVRSTAFQAVEDAFGVKLDKMNAKTLKTQYKGVPQPAIIRKPIPGHPVKEALPDEIPEFVLPTPYPDNTVSKNATGSIAEPSPSPLVREPSSEQQQQHPTEPHYTVKYRSCFDLQDYRCSRDSAPSPRPNEIVITIDLPLIRSAGDIDLNVTEKHLVLESQKPAYKLELQLSYPVDDNQGDAKFIKAKKQLTVTLPVLPAKVPAVVLAEGKPLVSDLEQRDEKLDKTVDSVVWCEVVGEEQEAASVEKDDQKCTNRPDTGSDAGCFRGVSVRDEKGELDRCSSSQAADELPTFEGSYTETSRSEQNSKTDKTDESLLSGPNDCTSEMPSNLHTKEETDSCSIQEEGAYHADVEYTALSRVTPAAAPENGTPAPAANADVLHQHKLIVPQQQVISTVSHTEKEECYIPNYSSSSIIQATGKPMASQSSTLEENTLKVEEVEMRSEEQAVNCSPVNITSPLEHKDIKCAPLIEEMNVPLEMQVDSDLHSSDQSQTSNFTTKTPAILRERTPEDDSEVIISDHVTLAALSFQNSLWCELD